MKTENVSLNPNLIPKKNAGYLCHSHGKIHPFLSSVNHLFRLGPSKNHGYVTNNQRVPFLDTPIYLGKFSHISLTWVKAMNGDDFPY